MLKLSSKGFTFAEVIVTVFVLATAIVSALLFFTNALLLTQYSKDITEATSHGEYLFEEMRSRGALDNIVQTNWQNWYASVGLRTLPEEGIAVTFNDAAADPLEIYAVVSWRRRARVLEESFATRMTK